MYNFIVYSSSRTEMLSGKFKVSQIWIYTPTEVLFSFGEDFWQFAWIIEIEINNNTMTDSNHAETT